jgi:hypothetical protein
METSGNHLVDIDNEAGDSSPLPIESVTGNGGEVNHTADDDDENTSNA